MKLQEVAGNKEKMAAIKTVFAYTDNQKVMRGLVNSIKFLMQWHSFQGQTYRTIFLPSKVLESVTVDQLGHLITTNAGNRVQAWSKTTRGMMNAVHHQSDSGDIEHNGAIMLVSTGPGLDVNTLGERDEFFVQEDEVLTIGMPADTKILGFCVGTVSPRPQYTTAQYAKFVQELKELEKEIEDEDNWSYDMV